MSKTTSRNPAQYLADIRARYNEHVRIADRYARILRENGRRVQADAPVPAAYRSNATLLGVIESLQTQLRAVNADRVAEGKPELAICQIPA